MTVGLDASACEWQDPCTIDVVSRVGDMALLTDSMRVNNKSDVVVCSRPKLSLIHNMTSSSACSHRLLRNTKISIQIGHGIAINVDRV